MTHQKTVEGEWNFDKCTCGLTVMCPQCDSPWIPIRRDGSHKAACEEFYKICNTPLKSLSVSYDLIKKIRLKIFEISDTCVKTLKKPFGRQCVRARNR